MGVSENHGLRVKETQARNAIRAQKNIMQPNPPPSAATLGKYRHIAFCFLPQVLFVLLAAGIYARGYWLLLPIVFLMVVVPMLDLLTGWQDNGHFEKGAFSRFDTFLLNWNTRIYALLYMTAVIYLAANIRHFTPVEMGLLV